MQVASAATNCESNFNRVFHGDKTMGFWINGLPFAAALAIVVVIAYVFCFKKAKGEEQA